MEGVSPAINFDAQARETEKKSILAALEAAQYNQSHAARLLGVSEGRIRTLMRRHDISPQRGRGRPRKEENQAIEVAASKLVKQFVVPVADREFLLRVRGVMSRFNADTAVSEMINEINQLLAA
jgi:transposase